MQRDFTALSDSEFDLAIIGGGATGAAIALDASLRGLSVALIDKGDFGAATSAGSTKLMHGGLRYLANGDIANVREGLRERRHWSRIAKHLVHPLPFIIPTYEASQPSKSKLKLGLYLYDWLAFDRNRAVDPMQKMPGHRHMTAAQLLGLSPDTPRHGPQGRLTGGLMYHDGQMLSPERLVLAMLRTAMQAGAVAVNYVAADNFIVEKGRVCGVAISDQLSNKKATLRAAMTVNATGPWADSLMAEADSGQPGRKLIRSKGIHLLTRTLTRGAALAVPLDDEHIFITPYMGLSLLATTDTKFDGAPDDAAVTEDDIALLLDKANRALPDAKLTRQDIIHAYVGLRPLVVDVNDAADTTYGLSRGSEIYDHGKQGGPEGLISALGGKWTTSRRLAEQITELACRKIGRGKPHRRSADTLLACTPRDDLARFMDAMRAAFPDTDTAEIDVLSRLYGVLLPRMMASDTSGLAALKDPILAARIAFALNEEMAVQLADVVLRRLPEGQLGSLSATQLSVIADYMAAQLGWSAAESKRQLAAVKQHMSLPTASRAASPKKAKAAATPKAKATSKVKASAKAKSGTGKKPAKK